jgi:hypothetical protein
MSDYAEAEALLTGITRLIAVEKTLTRNSRRSGKDRPPPRTPPAPPTRSATRSGVWKSNCGRPGVSGP